MPERKFRVGDKVRWVNITGSSHPSTIHVGLEGKIVSVDRDEGSTMPYQVSTIVCHPQWVREDQIELVRPPRDPEVIRAGIKALEAELAEATKVNVGDVVTIKGTVDRVDCTLGTVRVILEDSGKWWFKDTLVTKETK